MSAQPATAGPECPSVSVIIPAYNAGRFLGRALDSVCAQTYPLEHLEVVVIDDGSSDETAEVAGLFAESLPGLQIYSQRNRGVAAARNLGILVSTAELVAFLDADDQWQPDKISRQVAVFADNPALGLVHCGCDFVDSDGHLLPDWPRKSRLDQGDILLEFLCDFFLITSAVMVPRAVLDEVGAFDEALRVGEDNELFLRILAAYPAGCATETLLLRTVRPDSLSREDYDLDARVDLEIIERFLAMHPAFARAHQERIDRYLAEYLFGYGYRLLDDGRVGQARAVFMQSLGRHFSTGAARSLLRSYLPHSLVRRYHPPA